MTFPPFTFSCPGTELLHRNLPASLDQANISNGAPVYSAAYLSELKASTPSSRRPPINDPYDGDMSMDVGDISMDSVDVFGMSFVVCSDSYSSHCGPADNETSMPSESSILNAKQRRERIRTTTAASGEDYISLSVIKRSDESKGPHPDSRLMREEDELGEGDDGRCFFCSFICMSYSELCCHVAEFAEFTSAQERIPLGKKSKKVAANKRKEAMQEMIEDAYVFESNKGVDTMLMIYAERKKTKRQWSGNKHNFVEVVIWMMRTSTKFLLNKYTNLYPVRVPSSPHSPRY